MSSEIFGELRPIAADGMRVLARTLLAMAGLAFVLAIVAYLVAGGGVYGGLTAIAALLLAGAASVFVAIKRTVLTVVRNAIAKAKLGERAVAMLFAKLPTTVTGVAERVPLAQAESMVRAAVGQLLDERAQQTGKRAWLARKAQARVVELVQRVTLAEFRAADRTAGGVDMQMVRDHLMATVQDTLIGRLDGMLSSVTVMAVAALSALCLGGAYLVRVLTESSWQ